MPHRSPGRGECRLRMERNPALWQTFCSMCIRPFFDESETLIIIIGMYEAARNNRKFR